MIDKLKDLFVEQIVYKDLKNTNFFSALSLPSFMRDWLLQHFENESGEFDVDEMATFVRTYIPRREDWTDIKNRIIKEYDRVKLLCKIMVDIDVGSGKVMFSLPDYGLTAKDTIIEDGVWMECKEALVRGRETWGMIELGYRPPEGKVKGKIRLLKFQNFCPYEVALEYFKEARKSFSIQEWEDLLLGAVDYNASGYQSEEQKLTMLTRLLPFVEKRLNLVELAPKGTGKSYLFGRVSRYGWLSSGGTMSRAKMFYDISKRLEGLVSGNDFITLDEVQTISFTDVSEMRAALKGYLESGVFTVGNYEGRADSGMILCGNIAKSTMEADGTTDMFQELPEFFHESALIDRFHGFIKGWNIPRMTDDLKISGWALNSEYFSSIMHELRSDSTYRSIVDRLIVVPEGADTRDTEAIKRIATAYLKLLFPHVQQPTDITAREFNRYCLRRACAMRSTIKMQLGIIDAEYRGKDIPQFTINEVVNGEA